MKLRKKVREEDLNWVEFFVDPESGKELEEKSAGAERIRFGLKYLSIGEMNTVQDDVYNVQAQVRGKGGTVRSKFQYGLYVARKMEAAIVKWEGIQSEEGKDLPISSVNINLLPAWIGERLVDIIDEMNQLGAELEGE